MDMYIECNIMVTRRQQALECDYCNQWQHRICEQGVRLAVAHSPVAIGNVGELLEGLSIVAHWASLNKIDNIMIVREFIIFCVIN